MRSHVTGRRARRRGALVLCFLLLAVAVPTAAAGDGSWRPARLDEGRNGKYLWGASLSRSPSRHGGQFPCVGLTLLDLKPRVSPEKNFGSFDQTCSSLALDAGPNIVLSSAGRGAARFTVGAFAVSPRIETVRLDLGAAGSRTVEAKLLNPRQRQNSGVRPARYGTLVVRGPYCLGEMVGYDGAGAVVYERPSEGCEAR